MVEKPLETLISSINDEYDMVDLGFSSSNKDEPYFCRLQYGVEEFQAHGNRSFSVSGVGHSAKSVEDAINLAKKNIIYNLAEKDMSQLEAIEKDLDSLQERKARALYLQVKISRIQLKQQQG